MDHHTATWRPVIGQLLLLVQKMQLGGWKLYQVLPGSTMIQVTSHVPHYYYMYLICHYGYKCIAWKVNKPGVLGGPESLSFGRFIGNVTIDFFSPVCLNTTLIDWVVVLRPAQQKIISETFPEPISWLGMEKLNLTQQNHAFINQKKCTTTQKTKARFSRILQHPAWKRRGLILVLAIHKFVTYLLRHLPTYLQPRTIDGKHNDTVHHCWLGHLTRKNPSRIWPIMCLVGC